MLFRSSTDIEKDWRKFLSRQREVDIVKLINEENLKDQETRKFLENAFRDGFLKTTGTAIDKIMPPASWFGKGDRVEKKKNIIEKLLVFFEKYFGLT